MRRNLARFPYCSNKAPFISSSGASAFSSSAGGRGRGRGSEFSNFPFTKEDESTSIEPPPSGFGRGQGGGGRGKPLPSSPILPPFSSFVDNGATSAAGSGRGRGRGLGSGRPQAPPQPRDPSGTPFLFVKDEEETSDPSSSQSPTPGRGRGQCVDFGPIIPPAQPSDPIRKPVLFVKEENHSDGSPPDSQTPTVPIRVRNAEEGQLSSTLLSALSGAGRGKPSKPPSAVPERPNEENRHIRAPKTQERTAPRLSREEATKKAVGILSRGGDGLEEGGRGGRGDFRGRGSRGRGLQAWRGRGGGGRGGRGRRFEDADDDYGTGLYLGDEADGNKLSAKLGPDIMNQLVEGYEEMSSRVLPSPVEDAYADALHTNLSIECEPEYLMEEFGTNPDIDEKPPIPLCDALEKMKPFLMAYEGIESQQEWEEVVEETMQRVPLLKEIVDYYSGPDRVTAKQQREELERVAKTLPESAPASVKQFSERAVLSLQSNPGWGFDKKCQLMDKLVREVSQNYK